MIHCLIFSDFAADIISAAIIFSFSIMPLPHCRAIFFDFIIAAMPLIPPPIFCFRISFIYLLRLLIFSLFCFSVFILGYFLHFLRHFHFSASFSLSLFIISFSSPLIYFRFQVYFIFDYHFRLPRFLHWLIFSFIWRFFSLFLSS